MSPLPDRKLEEVRRMLDGPHPTVPPDLARRATEQGRLLLARRRAVQLAVCAVALLALLAFGVWAAAEQPWERSPADTTPPLEGW